MYAVIKTGGKQYTVSEGDEFDVEKLDGNVGDPIELSDVLAIGEGEGLTLGTPNVENAKVVAEIVAHHRAKKIIVFKMKRRKGYSKKQGHRQNLTTLRIKQVKA